MIKQFERLRLIDVIMVGYNHNKPDNKTRKSYLFTFMFTFMLCLLIGIIFIANGGGLALRK